MIVSLSVITPGFYNGTEMVGRKKKKIKKSNFKWRRPVLHINRCRCFINVSTTQKVSTVSRCLHVIATMSNMSCTWVQLFLLAVVLPFAAHLLMDLIRMSPHYLWLKAQYGRKGVILAFQFGQWGWKMSENVWEPTIVHIEEISVWVPEQPASSERYCIILHSVIRGATHFIACFTSCL